MQGLAQLQGHGYHVNFSGSSKVSDLRTNATAKGGTLISWARAAV